jgi:hypothetical protein
MSKANSKTKRGRHLTLRVSDSLVAELEASAARDRRPVSDYVRQVLIDAMTPAMMARQQQEGTTDVSGRGS